MPYLGDVLVAVQNLLESLGSCDDNIRPWPQMQPDYWTIFAYKLITDFHNAFSFKIYFIASTDEELMGLCKQKSISYRSEDSQSTVWILSNQT